MKLRDEQINVISFFKDKEDYECFINSENPKKWEWVNEFYKWQLIRRNKSYADYYEFTKDDDEEIKTRETQIHWGMEPLVNPDNVHSEKKIVFHYKKPFSVLGNFSYNEFQRSLENNVYQPFLEEKSLSEIDKSDIEAHFNHPDEKRFILISLDLSKKISNENLKEIEETFNNQRREFLEENHPWKYDKIKPPKNVLDYEKNLFIFDRVYLLRKARPDSSIVDEFNNRFGGTGLDLKSVKDRFESVSKWIDNARYIQLDIEANKWGFAST